MIVNTEFSEAVVESLHDVTPTVRELRIRPIAHKPVPHDPGAHLQVQILVAGVLGQPQVQTRHYSLVGEPDGEHYRIAVKRQDDGRGGSLAMWRLAAGDRLVVSAPQNHFPLDTRAPDYLLVAGGIGITPMVMMAQRLAARGAPVRMIYSARSAAELAFAEELKPVLGDRLGLHAGDRGEHADLAAAIDGLADGGLLYTCGPVPMLDAIKLAWSRAGRPQQDLRFETFGSGGSHAAQEFAVMYRDTACRSPCLSAAACWRRWSTTASRRYPIAGAASAACAPSTCCRSTARSTTATCSCRTRKSTATPASAPACRVSWAASRSTPRTGPTPCRRMHEPGRAVARAAPGLRNVARTREYPKAWPAPFAPSTSMIPRRLTISDTRRQT